MDNILFLGAGSWASALSYSLSVKGIASTMWHRNSLIIESMMESRIHYLIPSLELPSNISFTSDIVSAIRKSNIIIIAIPSQSIRLLLNENKDFFSSEKIIVNVSKGIENDSLMTVSQVIKDVLGDEYSKIVTLSGPSHAEEVIKSNPTTLVAASDDKISAKKIQSIFSSKYLRTYISKDIIGVELGGSIKNVIAIASGICDGIGYGDNTKAALLTRGISEITNLGITMGAKSHTFQGLSGIGDLIVTALSKHSRNRKVGEEIGRGNTLESILSKMNMIAEGVKSSISVNQLKIKYNVEMPICDAIFNILFKDKNPKKSVFELMARELKIEE